MAGLILFIPTAPLTNFARGVQGRIPWDRYRKEANSPKSQAKKVRHGFLVKEQLENMISLEPEMCAKMASR